MKIALIGDLHGNRAATLALEEDLLRTQPDKIICLGDVAGKGPCSDFTCDWAFQHCHHLIAGNWDVGLVSRMFPKDVPYWEQLGEARLQKLADLPLEMELTLSGRRIRLIHGRPVMRELIHMSSPREDIEQLFIREDGTRWDVVAYADAHRQGMRTITPGLLLNCGSVGNGLGLPLCCYAILEGEDTADADAPFEVRFRQLPYDRAMAIRDAEEHPEIPRIESFIREVETGRYSRH